MSTVGDAPGDVSTGPARHATFDPEPPISGGSEQQPGTSAAKRMCPDCKSTGVRNLVVCIDGTANQFGTKNTNVVEIYNRLVKDKQQLTLYTSGIGTYAKSSRKSLSRAKEVVINTFDLVFASRLDKIIRSAYAWLVDNYEDGDRIFLFGFSRGAYQVRALAAMIHTVGLLHKGNIDQIKFAYGHYATRDKKESIPRQSMLPKTPSRVVSNVQQSNMNYDSSTSAADETSPEGDSNRPQRENKLPTFPKPPAMPKPRPKDTHVGQKAIQEQYKSTFSRKIRVHFVGAWDTVSSVGLVPGKTLPGTTEGMQSVCYFRHALALHEKRVKFLPEYANGGQGPDPKAVLPRTDFAGPHTKEVWFSGSHSDIGGGSTMNTTLDNFGPALRWMSWEAMLAGLRLDNAPPNWVNIGTTRSMTKSWRILEYLPLKRPSYQDPPGSDVTAETNRPKKQSVTRSLHKGANRHIKPRQRIHQSVIDDCGPFQLPPLVEREVDVYIAAADLLRPLDVVKQSQRVLDESDKQRLELLLYSGQGQLSLRNSKDTFFQYICATARSCRNIEGKAQIFRDLRSLHVASVLACFKVARADDMDQRLIDAHVTESTSAATFPFHICGHTDGISSVAFLSPNRVVSGSWDQMARIWDVSTGEMTIAAPLSGHTGHIACVSAGTRLVASASKDASVRLWQPDITGDVQHLRILHDGTANYVLAIAFSPDDSYLVSGSSDGSIRLWDTARGTRLGEPMQEHDLSVNSVTFSPDGTWIVTGSADSTVCIWDWSPGEATALLLQRLEKAVGGHTGPVSSVACSQSRVIASGSADMSVRLWDPAGGPPLFTLEGHVRPVSSVAFDSRGRYVVSGSHDWTVRIWDTLNGDAVRVLRGHTGRVLCVAFSPDGTRIASGSDDKTIRVWDVVRPPDERARPDDGAPRATVPAAEGPGQAPQEDGDARISSACATWYNSPMYGGP